MALGRYDAHVKAVDGVQERTAAGAVITIVGLSMMVLLLLYEFLLSGPPDLEHHMSVDGSTAVGGADASVDITLHITFPHLKCGDVELDFEATRGDSSWDPVSNVQKAPAPAPSPGAEGLDGKEGCTFQGGLVVGKVGGNLKFAVADHNPMLRIGSFMLNRPMMGMGMPMLDGGGPQPNISHVVHEFSFGKKERGMTNPLDGVVNTLHDSMGQYQYMIKVIPTVYRRLSRRAVSTHQYSIAEQFVKLDMLAMTRLTSNQPGIYFFYDFYPVAVEYWEQSATTLETVTSLCAIVGGMFVISSIVDGLVHTSMRTMSGKAH